MKALILGGCGFIGSHLADALVARKCKVTVVDAADARGCHNLAHLMDRVEFICGNTIDKGLLAEVLSEKDIVYCLANSTNPAASWHDPFLEIDNHLKNCIRLFRFAARAKIKKVVFPSSGGTIYGAWPTPVSEEVAPQPFSPYGIVNLAIENFLAYYARSGDFSYDIFRIGNVYGPRQSADKKQGVVAVWMSKIAKGETIEVFGDDTTLRDYIYVTDIARLMTHSLSSLDESGVYNLGSGKGTSIFELLSIIKASIPVDVKTSLMPKRASDNKSIILDNRKILSRFKGFRLSSLEEKLPETWEYYSRLNHPRP